MTLLFSATTMAAYCLLAHVEKILESDSQAISHFFSCGFMLLLAVNSSCLFHVFFCRDKELQIGLGNLSTSR
jgi:hypothetical protein